MKFEMIHEAVLYNKEQCVLDRVELRKFNEEFLMPPEVMTWWKTLSDGDTIKIVERETEIE